MGLHEQTCDSCMDNDGILLFCTACILEMLEESSIGKKEANRIIDTYVERKFG